MLKAFLTAAAIAGLASASANAGTVFAFDETNPSGQNTAGGSIGAMHSTFDTLSQVFTWNVTYTDGVSKHTGGYWLVVSDGPNPKGIQKQLAIVYFDASTSLADPTVSVYRYNGQNSNSSFGDPGDLLASTKTPGQTTIQAGGSDSAGKRTFSLTINAAGINGKYTPGNGYPDWEGIRYSDKIGVWMHSTSSLKTQYSGQTLGQFSGNTGWCDDSDQCTTCIPAPGAAALYLAGAVLAIRRRRY